MNKIALVTGANRGIGFAVAKTLLDKDYVVILTARSESSGQAAIDKLGHPDNVHFHALDVSNQRSVDQIRHFVDKEFGRLDVLINNAGLYPLAAVEAMSEDEWDLVVDTNLKGVFLCTQAAARQMKAQEEGGTIVNIASIEGESPAPLHSHYNAAKAGVLMYTQSAALELAPLGIRVNSVSPGLIWREGIEENWPEGVEQWRKTAPLERLGKPDDVADACLFFASPASRWITGANLRVDGGVLSSPIF